MALRVLVTGATGTVGGAVIGRLARNPAFEVHAVVRRLAALPGSVHQIVLDLDAPGFGRSLQGTTYHGIVHAAQPRDWAHASSETFDLRVIRELESVADRTTRLIYTGGVWVYGHQRSFERITESSPLSPLTYAIGRRESLEYLRRRSPHRWVEVALPSLVYGSVGPLRGMGESLRAGTARVVADPSILWSVIERLDVAEAYELLLLRDYRETVFVLAEPIPIPALRVYQQVAQCLGIAIEGQSAADLAECVEPRDLEVLTANQPVNASLFFERMEWKPKFSFETRIGELVNSQPG